MRAGILSNIFTCLYFSTQVCQTTRIQATRLPAGPTKVVEAPSGDATTTYYIGATKNSQHPVGALTSIVDTFVGQGTTTEYMTQHIGTHIDNTYAKIQTTSSREYYRIDPTTSVGQYGSPVRPTGLIGSSTSLEVHGPASTFYTVEEYRTYVDGHYAHLVSSISNVVTDPAYITPTPVFSRGASVFNSDHASAEQEIRKSLYSSYEFDIKPSRAHKFGVATRTVGRRPNHHQLDNEIEADLYAVNGGKDDGHFGISHKVPRQIDLDAVESESFAVRIEPDKPVPVSRPTYTVGENGELNFPAPVVEAVTPEPVSQPSLQHRFGGLSKTVLDSVTYVGFVDFTTTIDDTVVIFRPKKTFSDSPKSPIRPQIVPTRSQAFVPQTLSTASRQNSPRNIAQVDITPEIDSSELSQEELTVRKIENENKIDIDDEPKKHTSGIDALKSLLSRSPPRSTKRTFPTKSEPPQQQSSPVPQSTRTNPFNRVRPSSVRPSSAIVTTALPNEDFTTTDPPVDIIASIDPTSDVELVFKTLYTTYTYFTTFFRESTTRVKTRKEVISNVITLTNILKASDLPAISDSCRLDSSCLFKSTDRLDPEEFSDGFFGRPNTRLVEEPRSGGGRPVGDLDLADAVIEPTESDGDMNAVLRTFFTTYTYYSTLFGDGTSTVSTRTEVYSNEQIALVPVSVINSEAITVEPKSIINISPTTSQDLSPRSVFPVRRLEVSSVKPVSLHSELTTPRGEEEEDRPSTDRVPKLFVVTTEKTTEGEADVEEKESIENEDEEEEITTEWIQPTPIYGTTPDASEEFDVVTQETPALTEEVTELITTATTESEEDVDGDAVTEFIPRTLYTTFTYFTTLFKEGDSIVTSNLETVTNVMTEAFVEPTTIEPSVTFFTTFTYWTTSIDGDNTVITSREETITDILPASVTDNLPSQNVEQTEAPELSAPGEESDEPASPFSFNSEILSTIAPSLNSEPDVFTFYSTHYDGESTVVDTILSTSGPVSSQVPEIQSGEPVVEATIASTAESTPDVSSIQPTSSFQDVDEDFTFTTESNKDEGEEVGVKPTRLPNRSRVPFTRPGNTFTPVIRPLLKENKKQGNRFLRPTNLRVSTTVATIKRQGVKPTLIATPASSAPQLTPSFGASSRPGFLASSSLFNRGQSRFSSSSHSASVYGSSSISPSGVSSSGISGGASTSALPSTTTPSVVISPLGIRRPNPFRARLKERQLERLANLRKKQSLKTRNPNRVRTSAPRAQTEESPIPIPNLPSLPGGNAPILVSTQRQVISPNRRVPKQDDVNAISVPKETIDRRERARERIKSLFSRERPIFGRTSLAKLRQSPAAEEATEPEQSRRKRQVRSAQPMSEFGSRTQARKSYVLNRRSANPRSNPQSYFLDQDNPPFTAFTHKQSQSQSQTQHQFLDYYYEDESFADDSDYSNSVRTPVQSSSRHTDYRRQAPSEVPEPTTRATKLRTRSRSRARLNKRPTTPATAKPRPRTTHTRTRSRFNFRTATTTTTTEPPRRANRFRPRSFNSGRTSNRFSSSNDVREPTRSRFGSSSSKSSLFTRGKVIDYNDYDYDYEDTALQSSQNDVPDYITVTHMVPFATQIPIVKFGNTEFRDILSTSPSLEVIAVTALKSTDINNSPIIYANDHTLTAQPGVRDIFFDALRATETTSITFTPTRIRGRRTSFSHAVPTTIYNVETVSTQVIDPVDQNQLLNSLLQQLLIGQTNNQQNPLLRPNQPPLVPQAALGPATPVTNLLTHTSTYVTTITEEQSTVIPITFRGKAITTTLVESSTKVITATEFSTETQVIQAPIQPTQVLPQLPQIAATQAPRIDTNPIANNAQLASLLPALLGVQQANLFNQQNEAALLQQQLLEQQQQQQLAEQLLAAQLAEQQLQEQKQHEEFNEELLARLNLDDFSDEDLASLDINAVVDAVTREQSKPPTAPLVFPNRNLFGTLPLQPTTAEIVPAPKAPSSSIITIFKSGSSPGDFTKVLSTVYLNTRRKRDSPEIHPSTTLHVAQTEAPSLDSGFHSVLGAPRGLVMAQLPSWGPLQRDSSLPPFRDAVMVPLPPSSLPSLTEELIQSGLVSEIETLSSQSVIPTQSWVSQLP